MLQLLDTYKGLAAVAVHDGCTCIFLHDLWGKHVSKNQNPELFSFVKNQTFTFQQVTEAAHHPHTLFHLALSELAFEQWLELQIVMAQFTLTDSTDKRVCICGSSLFSCNKALQVPHWPC